MGVEFSADDTHGFVELDSFDVCENSDGLGWGSVYLSVQSEQSYAASFGARPDILIAVVNEGSIQVDVGTQHGVLRAEGPIGSVSIIPDGMAFDVDSRTPINTTHLYLRRAVLDDVGRTLFRREPSNTEIIPRMAISDPALMHCCQAVRSALVEDPMSSGLYVDQMARTIAAKLLQHHSNADGYLIKDLGGGLSTQQLRRARELIESRLRERLTVADLAAGSGLNPEYFNRLFKQSTGLSLYQSVIHQRVDRVAHLLTETTMPITAIADECGFSDQVHLTRTFRRILGTSPAAYRKERQK